jgi:hypothetical protein
VLQKTVGYGASHRSCAKATAPNRAREEMARFNIMSDSDCIEKMNEGMRTGDRCLVLQENAGELAFGKGNWEQRSDLRGYDQPPR